MITGFQALQSIEDAYAKARGDEMRLDAALRSASENAARLRQERLSELHALAQVKLGLIQRGELVDELDAAERAAKELVDRLRREIDDAAARRHDAAEALQKAEAAKNQLALDYDAAVAKLRAFEDAAAPGIVADAFFATQHQQVEKIREILNEAEKKTAQAESDRAQKKTPYEQDPLFIYLWRRHFGASDYRAGFLVRAIDDFVARLIGYQKARANYSLLNQIPDRLREHTDRVRAEFDSQQQRLIAFRQDRLIAAGAGPLQDSAAKAKAALDAAEAAAAKAGKIFEQFNRDYITLAGRDNQGAFAKAIELMTENDSRDEVVTLYKEAARTKTDEDQAIVAKIDRLTKAVGKADAEIAQLRRQIQATAARRVEIQQARNDFRQRRYDYPGTTFGNDGTINDVLGGILDGIMKGAVLDQVLQQGYRRPPASNWGAGMGTGPSGPRGDDGSSGDGFSTGGSF
jgi:hypothetical protein